MYKSLERTMAAVFAAVFLLICVPAATQALAVSEAENVPTVIDGVDCMVDYHADGTALIWKISDPAAPTELTIPATLSYDGYDYTVTELSWSAFSAKAPNITALTLPDTLTELNSLSFGVFPSLTELVIPGSVKTFTASFQNMKNLERITFSEGVEEIAANSMVNGCSKLKEIVLPESLKKISQPAAFSGASALETINLPEGVEITQGSTFRNCTSLKSVTLPASVTKLTSSMFSGCTALESVTALGAITEVGDSAFDGCTKLKTVAGLESVTKVGSYAFRNCESLGGSPKLSELTEVGSYAFSGCKNFAADLSGAQFAGVGMNAFYDCNNITGSPDFSRLTTIGKNAFYGCYHLGGSLDLSGLTSVPDYAFIYYGFFSSEPVGLSLGSGIESIGAGAFMYMTFDSSDLTIPGSVESIGQWAFDETNLTDVTIDASPDDVVVADGAFPAGVAPVYTLEAVTGDDTFDVSGETIHDAAAKGGAIALTKDVVLSEPLVISSDVTITGEHTITADRDEDLQYLILVEPDAALTLTGVTLNGRYVDVQNGGGVVICEGELNIESGVTISKAIITAANSGTVRVTGELNMTGGGICDNVVSGRAYSCPGVLVAEGGAFNMSGGEISGNSGYRGSAVLVYSSAKDGPASFTMSGGEISGNTSSGGSGDSARASGAVHVEGYASFTLEDNGVISNNKAPGGVGGGVCVVDPDIQNGGNGCGTAFTMKGGVISGNSAQTGGGIYSYSNDVSLEAGEISGNAAGVLGGGVYSEGNSLYYSTLHMKNVLITDNSAAQGGGLWFCATGETTIYPAQGAAIFGNSAKDAGDDFAFTQSEGGHSATLAGNVPGGGSAVWYKDGGIYLPSGGGFFYPSVDESVPRFGREGADKTPVTVTNDAGSCALKSVVSDETKAAAEELPLVIRGNSAQYGGGVGSNGGVVIGVENVETGTLHVEKVWEGDAESFRPGEVEVVLKYDGAVADRVKLTSLGGWEHSFTGLTGDMDKYTVAETAVTNYTSAVSGSAAEGFTITNSFEPGALTITPADITVYMGGSAGYEGVTDDGGQIVGSSSLPMPGFTFDGLPEGADPTKLTLIGEDGSSWTVEPYPGLPEDAKRPLYTFNAVGGSHEVRIQFINDDEEVVTFDDFEVGSVVNQTLKMTLYPESISGVTAWYGDAIFSIVPGEGTLTVRGTTENVEYGYVNREPEAGSPGVTAAADTQFTINGSEVVSSDSVALLFDDIIESGPGAVTNKAQLREAALNVLGSGNWSFEYKYLDLVERDNGDAWVEADGPVTVYWPRPEEAPDDAQFALLHFEGLHRSEDDGGYELVAVPLSESEDGEHLCFTIASGGFSPFVLAWKAPKSPNLPPVEPSEPEYVPDWLNTKDHFAYIIGYEDGTVRPNASITRAETATIFFRLLTDEARSKYWSSTNSYADVNAGDWYNNAISTLSNMGILGGYEDGAFRPNATVTRAEFAKIAVSFFEYGDMAAENIFTDVAPGSWYASCVAAAAKIGLIEGYEDGTFRPDAGITRAEACAIVNRTLSRVPEKDHLLPESEMNVWPDNTPEAWYYADMQEATNSHEYKWLGNIEQWLEKLPERDWDELEY